MDSSKKNTKLMNAHQVIQAARAAQRLDLNRKFNIPWLVSHLDHDRINTCSLMLLHDKKDGQATEIHARCHFYLAIKRQEEAEEGVLDVPMEIFDSWRSLADIEAEESGQYGQGKATTHSN
jgi:hypothetical protein